MGGVKKGKKRLNEDDAGDDARSKAFTRGWNESLQQREGLPIKKGDNIIRRFNTVETSNTGDDNGVDDKRSKFL